MSDISDKKAVSEPEKPKKKLRIGIMGGTFDPIHVGHLMAAEAVRDECKLDQVLFIPAAIPPHKRDRKVADARDRYNMTILATLSNANFEVSDIELRRTGPSYSVDTIKELKAQYGDTAELFFITGADTIPQLHTWNRIEELLSICNFIGTSRPGTLMDVEAVKASFGELGKSIHHVETPELEISSTDIRDRVKKGYSIRYIVPTSVIQYIYKNGLYK